MFGIILLHDFILSHSEKKSEKQFNYQVYFYIRKRHFALIMRTYDFSVHRELLSIHQSDLYILEIVPD